MQNVPYFQVLWRMLDFLFNTKHQRTENSLKSRGQASKCTVAFLKLIVSRNSGGVSGSSSSQKWQQYFRVCSEAEPVVAPANVFCIVSAALSVYVSNAFCERVFSLMNSKWRAERNRASVALIVRAASLPQFRNEMHGLPRLCFDRQ